MVEEEEEEDGVAMDERWRTLPRELLHRILDYGGRVKYRRGAYVNQLNLRDKMYRPLFRIPRPQILPDPFDPFLNVVYYTRVIFSNGVSRMEKRMYGDSGPLFAKYYGFSRHYALFYFQGFLYMYHREYTWSWYAGHMRARIGEWVVPVFRAVVRFLQHI